MATIFAKGLNSSLLSVPFTSIAKHTCPKFQNCSTNFRYLKSSSIKYGNKRTVDRKQTQATDDGSWSVIAYNLSEELKIDNAQRFLENFKEYQINNLPTDLQEEAVMLSLKKEQQLSNGDKQPSTAIPLNDIFLFREGSVVFWGVPYDQQRRVLYGLTSLKVNPNSSDLIQEEKEHINYTVSRSIDRSRFNRDTIQLAANRELELLQADQFAFSHAVSLSVKLAIWEMMLDKYIESVEWITDSMKNGKDIKLTKDQVFRKTGEILGLKHSINLDSDLLDLPDIYWDRRDQEDMFTSLFAYLNIRKRTTVINEKLNNCCELMNLLASHMNDKHHIRLEWMIIVLIAVEVLFEIARFL